MKRFLICATVISLSFNLFFLFRILDRAKKNKDFSKLYYYKDIPFEQGYNYFLNKIKKKYAEEITNRKVFVVFLWDSLMYHFSQKEQMHVLDSMAADFIKHDVDFVTVTEMEETASKEFLLRNKAKYNNVKSLYDMDDFISGLYNNKSIGIMKPQTLGSPPERLKENCEIDAAKHKQRTLYLIMDASGNILYLNGNKFMILKDTLFINKLYSLSANPHFLN